MIDSPNTGTGSAIPELPASGYTLSCVCKNPIGTISVEESKAHPGYLDMTVTNGTEIVSTERPVKHGEFAKEYLATMIAQELPNAVDFRWKTYETPPERATKLETSRVYFVYSPDADKVKIGFSDSPESRMKSMQTGSPVPLELLGTIPGGQDVEMELHERFKSDRSHGEWFRMTSEIERFIRREARGR
ncbi:GIY-YIG nuclease family protein [Corynebacterium casei]|uniref:GIY-YIG nuclease family protein n=1 Tax=Corynebacterium casei TaxID=160386 RepID=UPI003FD6B3A0